MDEAVFISLGVNTFLFFGMDKVGQTEDSEFKLVVLLSHVLFTSEWLRKSAILLTRNPFLSFLSSIL